MNALARPSRFSLPPPLRGRAGVGGIERLSLMRQSTPHLTRARIDFVKYKIDARAVRSF